MNLCRNWTSGNRSILSSYWSKIQRDRTSRWRCAQIVIVPGHNIDSNGAIWLLGLAVVLLAISRIAEIGNRKNTPGTPLSPTHWASGWFRRSMGLKRKCQRIRFKAVLETNRDKSELWLIEWLFTEKLVKKSNQIPHKCLSRPKIGTGNNRRTGRFHCLFP